MLNNQSLSILKKIASINLGKSQTIIHKLAEVNDDIILNFPLKYLVSKDIDGNTPIHFLAKNGNKNILKLSETILSKINNKCLHPIHLLVQFGKLNQNDIDLILKMDDSILMKEDNDGINVYQKLAHYQNYLTEEPIINSNGVSNYDSYCGFRNVSLEDALNLHKKVLQVKSQDISKFDNLETPLFSYCRRCKVDYEFVKKFLNLPIDILNYKNRQGESILYVFTEFHLNDFLKYEERTEYIDLFKNLPNELLVNSDKKKTVLSLFQYSFGLTEFSIDLIDDVYYDDGDLECHYICTYLTYLALHIGDKASQQSKKEFLSIPKEIWMKKCPPCRETKTCTHKDKCYYCKKDCYYVHQFFQIVGDTTLANSLTEEIKNLKDGYGNTIFDIIKLLHGREV